MPKIYKISTNIERIINRINQKGFDKTSLISSLESISKFVNNEIILKFNYLNDDDIVNIQFNYHDEWTPKSSDPFHGGFFPKYLPFTYVTSIAKMFTNSEGENSFELVHTSKITFQEIKEIENIIKTLIMGIEKSYLSLTNKETQAINTFKNMDGATSNSIIAKFKQNGIEDIFAFNRKIQKINELSISYIHNDLAFYSIYFSDDDIFIVKSCVVNDKVLKDFLINSGIEYQNGECFEMSLREIKNLPKDINKTLLELEPKTEIKKATNDTYTSIDENLFFDNDKENDEIIGIFDGSITEENKQYLLPLITTKKYHNDTPVYDDHAEAVSTIAAYNHVINKDTYVDGLKGFNVEVFEVIGQDIHNEKELLKNITKVLEENSKRIKIYVFSMNLKYPSTPLTKINKLSYEFDMLQKKYGVRFIVSASNSKHRTDKMNESDREKLNYISPPADSVFSLVVGGHDGFGEKYKYSNKGFTTFLPLKPDISEFAGGNPFLHLCTSIKRVKNIIINGGTSFAAPLAARKYAYVLGVLKRENPKLRINQLLLMTDTLLINSAVFNQNKEAGQSNIFLGWGSLPEKATDIWGNVENEVLILIEENVINKNKNKMKQIFIPTRKESNEKISKEVLDADVYISISTDVEIDFSKGVEYIGNSVRFSMNDSGPKENKKQLNIDPSIGKDNTGHNFEFAKLKKLGKYKNRINTKIRRTEKLISSTKHDATNNHKVTVTLDSKNTSRDSLMFTGVIRIVSDQVKDIDYLNEFKKEGWNVVQVEVKTPVTVK